MAIKYDLKDMYTFTCHSPVLVSTSDDESDEEFDARWKKFDALPEITKEKLSDAPKKIALVTQELDLTLEQAVVISRFVRKFYFGEAQIEMLPLLLTKNGVPENIADQATSMIDRLIFQDDSIEKKYWQEHENIPLAKALRKYPNLGEQVIASGRISVKGYQEPVRPTINNWLTDYTTRLGYRKHSSMERGDYLYKEETTKFLSGEEKQRLSQILRSFDEKTPLTIKTKEQQVIFDQNAPKQEITNTAPEPDKPIFQPKEENAIHSQADSFDKIPGNNYENFQDQYQKMSFSSPQKMAYEKNQEPSIPMNPNTVNLKNVQLDKKPVVPEHNIVNLKDLEK